MTPMTTRRALLAALACAALTIGPAFGQAADPSLIHIGAALDDQTTALLYGQHSGMFARAGLNVEVQKFNSGSIVAGGVVGEPLYSAAIDSGKYRHPERSGYLEAADLQAPIDIAAKYKAIPKAFAAQEMISPFALKAPGR